MSVASRKGELAHSAGQAIATMCFGIFCLVVNDAMAKWLTAYYHPLQIVFMRYALALPIVIVAVLSISGRAALQSRHLPVHALRGLLLVVAAFTFFTGLKFLPLAEATSLIFAAPIFITALSVPLLAEHVGRRRWAAVIAGFAGVLIIVRPGAAAFQPASLIVVATAILYAFIMISVRWIGRGDRFWTMMFHMAFFPALFSGLAVPFVWQSPQWPHMPLFFAMSVFGTFGLTLISQAFRLAPAAIVAPFDYTALIWASLFGWLFWEEIPTVWTYLGAAVIIVSGLYIVIRETRKKAARA